LTRIALHLLQLRQPLILELAVETPCVERPQHIADNPLRPDQRKGKLRLERHIRTDKDLAEKFWVILDMARILPGLARLQANTVERRQVFRRSGAQAVSVNIHAGDALYFNKRRRDEHQSRRTGP